MIPSLLLAHSAVGLLALIAYWTAGLSRKGSVVHRKAGRVFVWTMIFVLFTACVFVGRFIGDGKWVQATFFGYLVVISATSLITGWLPLKLKKDHRRYLGPWYRALAILNIFCGLAMLLLGLKLGELVMAGFSMIGLIRGGQMLRLSTQPESPRWWLLEHLGSMIGNGVAVHVAVLLIGLGSVLPKGMASTVQAVGWLLPLGVAAIAGVVFGRRYGVQKNTDETAHNPTA